MADIYKVVQAQNVSDLTTQVNALCVQDYVPVGDLVVSPTMASTSGNSTAVNQFNFFQALMLKTSFNYDYLYKPFGGSLY